MLLKRWCVFSFCLLWICGLMAQPMKGVKWSRSGNSFYEVKQGSISEVSLVGLPTKIIVSKELLTPKGQKEPLHVENFFFSDDGKYLLIYTQSRKVWRYNTRGNYWVLNRQNKTLKKIGSSFPEHSLMFAKLSPDGSKVAYVSGHNLYVEDLKTHVVTPLTTDGTERIINGTFDWAYEEEFNTRDGFRWSPDGKSIAFWRVDARAIRNFLMINNTDSIYSYNVPVEYPKVGYKPSSVKIGIVHLAQKKTVWTDIPGAPDNNYLPRMEWVNNQEIVVQQLNRQQNETTLYKVATHNGISRPFYKEKSTAWIDIKSRWHNDNPEGWDLIANNHQFLWMTEKDGWRHLYKVDWNGKEQLLTKGNYDVIDLLAINEAEGYFYFLASPDNATQQYLYRQKLDGTGTMERLSPNKKGFYSYDISPDGKYARYRYSNINEPSNGNFVSLPKHQELLKAAPVVLKNPDEQDVQLITITTADGVTMDASVMYPKNFDSTKKYPVVFYVYTEPGGTTVKDQYGNGRPYLYDGDMAADGYFYISIDSRGTPAPKGAAWRKAIYEKVGILNVHDQYMATKEVLKWPFIDKSRVAVWGWSGGGSTTLNLLFQYPATYQTGIAIAAVANRLTYDNIYEERYMNLPNINTKGYYDASAIHHAAGLQGNLLLVHGTGDDNVHYQNAEMLIDALVQHGKQFQLMSYPNRSHSIIEGKGTRAHLMKLFTQYLQQHCPPGGR